MGRILPPDVAAMTKNQVAILMYDRESFCGEAVELSEGEAIAKGLAEPGKSAYELAQERAAAKRRGDEKSARRQRRREKAVSDG